MLDVRDITAERNQRGSIAMKSRTKAKVACFVGLFALSPLFLSATAAPAEQAASTEQDVWTKRPNGAAHHVQSGFACPQALVTTSDKGDDVDIASLVLTSVIVGAERQPSGTQVGCEYEGRDGAWASIEFTKIGEDDSVSKFERAARKRIKAQYPDVIGDGDLLNFKPKSPTGGRTYAFGYERIRVRDRQVSIVAVGGDVGGWMITIIQFDYAEAAAGLKIFALTNWLIVAGSRVPPR